jgi:hypothetical protein
VRGCVEVQQADAQRHTLGYCWRQGLAMESTVNGNDIDSGKGTNCRVMTNGFGGKLPRFVRCSGWVVEDAWRDHCSISGDLFPFRPHVQTELCLSPGSKSITNLRQFSKTFRKMFNYFPEYERDGGQHGSTVICKTQMSLMLQGRCSQYN